MESKIIDVAIPPSQTKRFAKCHLDIFSYGVATSRYCSLLTWKENYILVPIGANIVLWNSNKLTREKILQYNTNAIMVLIENDYAIFSISYDGEIIVINKDNLTLMTKSKTQERLSRHASVNNKYLVVSTETGQHKGCTEVFDLQNLYNENSMDKSIIQVIALNGKYRYCHVTDNHTIFTLKEQVLNKAEIYHWKTVEVIADPKKSKPKRLRQYSMHNINIIDQKETKEGVQIDHINDVISSASNNKNYVVFMYGDRNMVIANSKTLEILAKTHIVGSGAIIHLSFHADRVYLTPKTDHLLQINIHDKLSLPPALHYLEIKHENVNILGLKSLGLCCKNYAFSWKKEHEEGISVNEDGIFILDFKNKKSKDISYFSVTCCGLALSHNTRLIASGDFSGNVFIYETKNNLEAEPLYRTNVMDQIRTLVFDSRDQSVLIGAMSGKIIRWYFDNFTTEAKAIASLDGAILNMRVNYYNEKENYLAVGTSNGLFAIYREIPGEELLVLVIAHYGHLPKSIPQNHNFGSLHLFSEIWSIVWSPTSNDYLATCSEDQTCIVWDLSTKNPVALHHLKGHTRAVTSIDWKIMKPEIGEIFVSCSDDQTFRVYNPKKNFELMYVDSTSFVQEWHTLTYLSLQPNGSKMAVGSQNGYLFIYDIEQRKFDYTEKVHTGSIEGLDWKGDFIVTCSSDNSINVIKLK